MNKWVISNYSKLHYNVFLFPLLLLLSLVLFLYAQHTLNTNGYVSIQKDCFFFLNSRLGQYRQLMYNLTQLGDALIVLSLLSVFIVYAPTLWESLITASLISSVISALLKNLFSIPRPAALFDTNNFIIIGQKLPGHNSLPSGHSITILTTLTVLLFAFLPQKKIQRIGWILLIISVGLILALTRVGVGAHYPLDVLIGSTVGYLCGLSGIFISRKYPIWSWVGNKKYYPLFLLLLPVCTLVIIGKIMNDALPVFYFAVGALLFSLYKMTDAYVKK